MHPAPNEPAAPLALAQAGRGGVRLQLTLRAMDRVAPALMPITLLHRTTL